MPPKLKTMRKISTLTVALATTISLSATVITDTVSTGPSYSKQVWYSLANDEQGSISKDNWDVAFQIYGYSASILANTQKSNFAIYQSPFAVSEWATVDTAGLSTWTALHNSSETWDLGALNTNPNNNEDLGWGVYDMGTHIISGDSIYIVKLANGEWKKFKVDQLASGKYYFSWANLDGTNPNNDSIAKSNYTGKNFAYYSLENSTALDREPASNSWDFTFTKYIATLYVPLPTPYAVTGLLQNRTVQAVKAYPVDETTVTHSNYTFESNISTIGYDWKSLNNVTFQYEIADSTVYFVKRSNGEVWKVVFKGFGGSANGNYIFTKELVHTAPTDIEEVAGIQSLSIFPNPAKTQFNLVYNSNETQTATVQILDMSGRIVLQDNILLQSGLNQQTISTANLQQGMYLVLLNGNKTQKLIIE